MKTKSARMLPELTQRLIWLMQAQEITGKNLAGEALRRVPIRRLAQLAVGMDGKKRISTFLAGACVLQS